MPLVEAEKVRVETRKVWPPVAPNGMTQPDLEHLRKLWLWATKR